MVMAVTFFLAASGMAVLAAFILGLKRTLSQTIGNFAGSDPAGLYILLLFVAHGVFLVSQGRAQTLQSPAKVQLLEPTTDEKGNAVSGQVIPRDLRPVRWPSSNWEPMAGAFSTPTGPIRWKSTPLSNFAEMLAILRYWRRFASPSAG